MDDAHDNNSTATRRRPRTRNRGGRWRSSLASCCATWAAILATPVQASLFQGDTLDTVANVISWVVLVVGPIIAIVIFWLVHILPEKIAEKKRHPQVKAIQTLCLLSLFFGGMLWPIAWLWAYSKPVLHKMAYGTDVHEHEEHAADASHSAVGAPPADSASEQQRLHMQVVDSAEEPSTDTASRRERA